MANTTFNTSFGRIILANATKDEDFPGTTFYDLYDENGGYYGQISTDNVDELTDKIVEEEIYDNIYL